ncbi:MAG: tyrosine-type recombinase/integrase, partial [Alphaproteobacteria bacterium]|nr:tyrosine-type recombinase/integrase [Alphaproteobacteria bacterium]
MSPTEVAKKTKPGLFADGGGLYLRVSAGKSAGKRWVFLYRRPLDGKRCEIGFGGTSAVPLTVARKKAAEARALLAEGKDPLALRQAAQRTPTFGELADKHIEAMSPSWRNPKHRAQWEMTLREYAKPLRSKPVDAITTADVLSVLRPIWQTIPETASRVRGRIENVLDAAKAQGFRSGENPAAWRGHLKLILPARQRLTRGHHAAMAIDDIPAFMVSLRGRPAVAARCLEFAILTAARTGETLGARWDEIDITRRVWTIPGLDPETGRRTKSARDHRVPLCARAMELINEMTAMRDGGAYVFPGQRRNRPMSDMALLMLLRRMGYMAGLVTNHGFRSTFRDWAGNRTNYPRELAEHALSHMIGDKA